MRGSPSPQKLILMKGIIKLYIIVCLILILPFPLSAETFGIMRPWFGPAGIVVDVIPLDDLSPPGPPYLMGDFGTPTLCNGVTMSQTYPMTDVPVSVPIYLWSNRLVKFRVPGWIFPAGTPEMPTLASVQIEQIIDPMNTSCDGNTFSIDAIGFKDSTDFIVRNTPQISSLYPAKGNWGSIVSISGKGFWDTQEKVYDQEEIMDGSGNMDLVCDSGEKCTAYGFSTYVELSASNDRYRVSTYADPWKDDQIIIKLLKDSLLDVHTGKPVPDSEFYAGNWQMQVITDYFKDTNLNGQHLMADGSIDLADEIIMRDIGPATMFTIVTIASPYINLVIPNPVPGGDTATIIGSNFGVSGVEMAGDGIGNDNGICENGEKCEVKLWNKYHTGFKRPVVKTWSNTEITIRIPTFSAPYPIKRDVQVRVPGGTKPNSNYYRLTIIRPGTLP